MNTGKIAAPENTFKEVKDIGVIWVMDEAVKLGFYNCNPDWM